MFSTEYKQTHIYIYIYYIRIIHTTHPLLTNTYLYIYPSATHTRLSFFFFFSSLNMSIRTAWNRISKSWNLTSGTESSIRNTQSQINSTLTDSDDYRLPINLFGFNPNTKNRLLTVEIGHELRTLLPPRIQLYTDWTLVYSLEQHGASLHSLYGNIQDTVVPKRRVGYLIIVRDSKGGLFGGYCNEPWLPNEHRRYGGNGECFLWKLVKVKNGKPDPSEHQRHDLSYVSGWRLVGFPYTGVNEFTMYCTSKFLSMGAGDGHYGLWVDDGLLTGVSYHCLTFGNEPLSQEGEKFHITGLEVWRIGGK